MALFVRLLIAASLLTLGLPAAQAADGHGPAEEKAAPEETSAEEPATEEGELPAFAPLWSEPPLVETSLQPYVLVRALRTLQDGIAAGNVEAHNQQRGKMQELSDQLRGLPVGVWSDVRNVRAAIYFVLSGGDPTILKTVIGHYKAPLIERRLIRGALAYGEGRMIDALSLMHRLDARKLDPGLGGMVALIQGTLISKKDPLKAVGYFDDARLMAPGTLVEEAALRQQILIVARDGQVERFDQLSGQYTRRFPNSIFARNFRRQFFAGVARRSFKGADEWVSRTETELQKMPPAERPALYLAIADEALKVGYIGLAKFAAGKARALSAQGSRTRERAKVFEGAAMAVTPDFEKGLALLKNIDERKISPSDREIRSSAMAVARNVGRWPEPAAKPDDVPPLESVGRARAMLTQVDTLLGGTTQ